MQASLSYSPLTLLCSSAMLSSLRAPVRSLCRHCTPQTSFPSLPRRVRPSPSRSLSPSRFASTSTPVPQTSYGTTIFAPATGKGKSAISILRISGDDALEVYRRMTLPARGRTQRGMEHAPPERRAVLRRVVHPETKEVLDEAVVLFFPGAFPLSTSPFLP